MYPSYPLPGNTISSLYRRCHMAPQQVKFRLLRRGDSHAIIRSHFYRKNELWGDLCDLTWCPWLLPVQLWNTRKPEQQSNISGNFSRHPSNNSMSVYPTTTTTTSREHCGSGPASASSSGSTSKASEAASLCQHDIPIKHGIKKSEQKLQSRETHQNYWWALIQFRK